MRQARRTLLSQIAIEFLSHLNLTWKSGFSEICRNKSLRIASDSDLGTPTIRRVKPVSSDQHNVDRWLWNKNVPGFT